MVQIKKSSKDDTKPLINVSRPYFNPNRNTLQWFHGMVMASIFSLVYLIAPTYILTSVLALVFQFPSRELSWLYATPLLVSALFPSKPSPTVLKWFRPMLNYFEYEQIVESSPVPVRQQIIKGNNYILACQPHGVISFTGICSAVGAEDDLRGTIPTAVASIVLHLPILKHVMGIFGLVPADKATLCQVLKRKGPGGCLVVYVGGIAELFLSCPKEERLFLSKRKGFIKLALTQGVDIVPIYMFGNTSVLTVLKTGLLARLSRKLQTSLTYFWGKYHLPIPRDDKLLYVSGQPLGMPQIANPTQDDIDTWHAKYCAEVTRIFDTYKERVPMYKHKKLVIL